MLLKNTLGKKKEENFIHGKTEISENISMFRYTNET